MRKILFIFVCIGLLSSGACSHGPCQTNDDCGSGLVCYGGLCGGALVCVKGKNCASSSSQSKLCQSGDKLCAGNVLKTCRIDGGGWDEQDCGAFHSCVGGLCLRKGISTTCGNGKVDSGEQCDDGNQRSGDGCSRYCLSEEIKHMEPLPEPNAPITYILGNGVCRSSQNRALAMAHKAPLYVKIAPIVCRREGRPIVEQATLEANIAHINKVFQAANLVFVLMPTRWEDDADRCEVFYSTESVATLNRYSLPDAIAIFYAMNISGGSFSLAGYANLSGIVMKAGPGFFGPTSVGSLNKTLAHELGHTFGLEHPHACRNGEEDKDNCDTHGDQLCDTPLDPGPKGVNGLAYCSGKRKNGQCTLKREATGCTVSCPGGETPLVNNLMSYYHCGSELTPGQVATVRCIALNDQLMRVSLHRPCLEDTDCGSASCADGRCNTQTKACLQHSDCAGENDRCISGTCTACVADAQQVGLASYCCSGTADTRLTCCSGKRCCGSQNHSSFLQGECKCDPDYVWADPTDASNFSCKLQGGLSCLLDAMPAARDQSCCSNRRDDQGKCCTGGGCCGIYTNSYTDSTTGECTCKLGFVRYRPNDPTNFTCQLKPGETCLRDFRTTDADDKCCSKERDDQGKCCTGKECCATRHFSQTIAGKCQCVDGYAWVAPNALNDHRCEKVEQPTCKPDGALADAADCCSQARDDAGKCCTGSACCSASNFASLSDTGQCSCLPGYEPVNPADPADHRCKQKPATPNNTKCALKDTLKGHTSSVTDVAFAPDGKTLASASYDKTVRIWDTTTGKEILQMRGHKSAITSLAFSKDGKTLISGDFARVYLSWDTATGKKVGSKILSQGIRGIDIRDDGAQIAFATLKGLFLVNPDGTSHTIEPSGSIRNVSYHPNNKQVAFGSNNKTVSIYNVGDKKRVHLLRGHRNVIFSIGFSPDGTILASGASELRLWDSANGKLLRAIKTHKSYNYSLAWHPTRKVIFTGGLSEPMIKLWDVDKGTLIQALTGHTRGIYKLHVSRDGKQLASGSSDKSIKLWTCQ